MGKSLHERQPPRGLLRAFFRMPIWLYRAHLGGLLGQRFLMLTHVGRVTGQLRYTVVEVVHHDHASDTYFIGSGWGERADWLRNIEKTRRVTVHVGWRQFTCEARRASPEEAAAAIGTYARKHPVAFRTLARQITGVAPTAHDQDVAQMAKQMPVFALRPAGGTTTTQEGTPP